jgi:hypothetical protein
MCEENSIMHASPIHEFYVLLNEEQKRKVAIMRMDMKIQCVKAKIHNMEKLILWSYLIQIWKYAGKTN